MTVDDRNTVTEISEMLKILGGQNGFCNLQPKLKKMLLEQSKKLKDIVDRDINYQKSFNFEEEWQGETVHET
ncbi:hypothetical protein [Pseudobutyrivibrio sp.]